MSRVSTIYDPGHRQPLKVLFGDGVSHAPLAVAALPASRALASDFINAVKDWKGGKPLAAVEGVKWERGGALQVDAIIPSTPAAA